MDPKLEAAKKEHGRLIVVEGSDGTLFAFRPATRAVISDIRANVNKDLEKNGGKLNLTLLANFCSHLCVVNKDKFEEFANKYPLKISGFKDEEGGISGAIFAMAEGDAEISVI